MVIPSARFPLFDLLPDNERQLEFQKLKMLRYGDGEVIYEQHGETLDVFFIFEGRVRIDSSAMRGNSAFFHYRRPGDMVGYYAAITGKPQPVTATATGAAWLGRMGAAARGRAGKRPSTTPKSALTPNTR
jgi:CRP-like cAMP-binding protein